MNNHRFSEQYTTYSYLNRKIMKSGRAHDIPNSICEVKLFLLLWYGTILKCKYCSLTESMQRFDPVTLVGRTSTRKDLVALLVQKTLLTRWKRYCMVSYSPLVAVDVDSDQGSDLGRCRRRQRPRLQRCTHFDIVHVGQVRYSTFPRYYSVI